MRVCAFQFGSRWACRGIVILFVAALSAVWGVPLWAAAPEPQEAEPAVAAPVARAWPKLSEAEQKAAVEAGRATIDEIKTKVPNRGFQLYETKRFLFGSDMPRAVVSSYLPYLDQMYAQLCGVYGVDPASNLWVGKAIIVAFADEASFLEHETIFYHRKLTPGTAQGLAHLMPDGRVLISCYAGRDPKYLAGVMVHETAHGFTARYRTNRSPPNWLNEGISEWVANLVVGPPAGIGRKVVAAAQRMQQSGSLGGDYFTAGHIAAWQYGAAASMVDYLVHYDPTSTRHTSTSKSRHVKPENLPFRKFIDGIKDGEPWEDSLKKAYGMTPTELARNYGQIMGIANLRP